MAVGEPGYGWWRARLCLWESWEMARGETGCGWGRARPWLESQAVARGEPGYGWGRVRVWLGRARLSLGESCAVAGGVPGCGLRSAGRAARGCQAARGWIFPSGALAGAGAGWQGLAGAGVSKPRHPTVPPQTPPRSIVASHHCCKASLVPHAEAPLGSADYLKRCNNI